MRCAVLGPKGTFSEQAAISYWQQEKEVEVVHSIDEIFSMLNHQDITDALIPLENSQAGTIEVCMVNLQDFSGSIHGEIYIPIAQHLIGLEMYELNDIELLLSQQAVYAQCKDYIKNNLAQVRTEITNSTAKAVQLVKTETKRAVAIGNEHAAMLYGLKIIKKNIQNPNNITRFVHICSAEPKIFDADKATMLFWLDNYPGSLCSALQVFAKYNLNLSKIESRPDPMVPNSYYFYADIDIKGKADSINNVLSDLKYYCKNVKFLGTYNSIFKT